MMIPGYFKISTAAYIEHFYLRWVFLLKMSTPLKNKYFCLKRIASTPKQYSLKWIKLNTAA